MSTAQRAGTLEVALDLETLAREVAVRRGWEQEEDAMPRVGDPAKPCGHCKRSKTDHAPGCRTRRIALARATGKPATRNGRPSGDLDLAAAVSAVYGVLAALETDVRDKVVKAVGELLK